MTQEDVKGTLLTIAERFGVPCVILATFIWMAREAAVSLHSTVVIPIVTDHREFLDRMCQTQEKQAETLEELAEGQNEIRSVLTTRGEKNFQEDASGQ
jgi:NAD(P)H-hydrate repair Nnr-like enzyme with NAD(P)H-hydrate dehydratase domain